MGDQSLSHSAGYVQGHWETYPSVSVVTKLIFFFHQGERHFHLFSFFKGSQTLSICDRGNQDWWLHPQQSAVTNNQSGFAGNVPG